MVDLNTPVLSGAVGMGVAALFGASLELSLFIGLAVIAVVFVLVERRSARPEPTPEFTDWRDWDWPIPDDATDWNFPEQPKATRRPHWGDLGEDLNEWKDAA